MPGKGKEGKKKRKKTETDIARDRYFKL